MGLGQEDDSTRRRRRARERALLSLDGLSLGDALGERFFGHRRAVAQRIEARQLPGGPCRWTDDTAMALSLVATLVEHGRVDQTALAEALAQRYLLESWRGYGGGAHQLLRQVAAGRPWREASSELFAGSGSYGNGAAMRVAPLGAYLADDLDRVARHAALSAQVTHAHPEGQAGAVAVALAAALAWRQGREGKLDGAALLEAVIQHCPASQTRDGIQRAAALPARTSSVEAAALLGSGQDVSAQDTVPFVLFCASHHLHSFEEAFWVTVAGLGDRDTTCAMVGGIVALSCRHLPPRWLDRREPLPPLP